ncbi:MAG: hypothetical protein ACPKM0_09955 [Pleomorphochaeta sp.]
MKRLIIYIITLILLISCVSQTENFETQQVVQNKIQNDLSLLNLSEYEDNVYVGVSSVYSTKEKMLEVAIINVAKNILIDEYLVLNKVLISENKSDFGYTKFDSNELFVYQDEHLPEIIESIEILEIHFSDEAGCIVIAKDTRRSGKKRVYKVEYDKDGIPTWVNERPEIDSYIVGVGSTLGYRLFVDSLYAADHEAIYDISSQYGNVTSYLQNYFALKQTDFSSYSQEGKVHQELAVVQGLTHVDYWYDEEKNLFYSLIIMKDNREN